jgi:acetyl-CoA acetyltransferase
MPDPLRGRTAVVGVGEAGLGRAGAGWTPLDLIARATAGATADAGLVVSDIDGVFCAVPGYGMPTLNIAEYLGLRDVRYSDSSNLGGASFAAHLHHAACAIAAGQCQVALIAYGSTQRSAGGKFVSVAEVDPWEGPHRPRYPATQFALAAARHMHQYGTTREQLARVAVEARRWAALTPGAFARDPLTVEDVIAARILSSPLGVLDACLVTDGAGAVILTSTERAGDGPAPPVLLLGAGEAHWHRSISQMEDLTVTAAVDSGRRAYQMAGVSPQDVDVRQLYDAFTISPILFLEDLGFCDKGKGGQLVAEGAIGPGGALPTNTNGGGLAYAHPGMYGIFGIIESVRHLRGQAGERQVDGAQVALAHTNGAVLSAHATVIFGGQATA